VRSEDRLYIQHAVVPSRMPSLTHVGFSSMLCVNTVINVNGMNIKLRKTQAAEKKRVLGCFSRSMAVRRSMIDRCRMEQSKTIPLALCNIYNFQLLFTNYGTARPVVLRYACMLFSMPTKKETPPKIIIKGSPSSENVLVHPNPKRLAQSIKISSRTSPPLPRRQAYSVRRTVLSLLHCLVTFGRSLCCGTCPASESVPTSASRLSSLFGRFLVSSCSLPTFSTVSCC